MLKSLYLLVVCLALASTGHTDSFHLKLSANQNSATNLFIAKAKNPDKIAIYQHRSSIKRPYRIIGKGVVSRRNMIGMIRHMNTMNEILRKKAAALGGDAIMNIKQDSKKIEGTIIAFEKALT